MHLRRLFLPFVSVLAMASLLTACGGGDGGDDGPGDVGGGDDELVVGVNLEIPDYFPSDFYFPEGLTIRSFSNRPDTDMIALTGTFESGDPAAIQEDVVIGLQAAGYELLSVDEGIAVFVRNGVGRVRVRTRDFLGELTFTVDIDTWTDSQLDELRALFTE